MTLSLEQTAITDCKTVPFRTLLGKVKIKKIILPPHMTLVEVQ